MSLNFALNLLEMSGRCLGAGCLSAVSPAIAQRVVTTRKFRERYSVNSTCTRIIFGVTVGSSSHCEFKLWLELADETATQVRLDFFTPNGSLGIRHQRSLRALLASSAKPSDEFLTNWSTLTLLS